MGDSVPMVDGVRSYSISDEGTLVYIPQTIPFEPERQPRPQPTLVWVDREGNEEPLTADPNNYINLRISPDGNKVALVIQTSDPINLSISIYDLIRENLIPFTFFKGRNGAPVWTLDSKQVIFASDREGGGIYIKAANVTGETEHIFSIPDRSIVPSSLSRDGKTLFFFEFDRQTDTSIPDEERNWDIASLSIEGEPERKVLLEGPYDYATTMISPDGRWMAYESNVSGEWEVYVCSFPDVTKDWEKVSTNGGGSPRWSKDSRELYYLAGADRGEIVVMAVTVETEPTFKLSKPETLFQGRYVAGAWDMHPDGRFLIVKRSTLPQVDESKAEELAEKLRQQNPRKINIVLNWFE